MSEETFEVQDDDESIEEVLGKMTAESLTDVDIAHKLLYIHRSARKRNIEFDLSFLKTKKLMKAKKCYFTGNDLNYIPNDDDQISFDRVDNDKGYTDDNVVACSRSFNSKKSDLTVEDIKNLYKGLLKHGDV
jgi:hypothetical protein